METEHPEDTVRADSSVPLTYISFSSAPPPSPSQSATSPPTLRLPSSPSHCSERLQSPPAIPQGLLQTRLDGEWHVRDEEDYRIIKKHKELEDWKTQAKDKASRPPKKVPVLFLPSDAAQPWRDIVEKSHRYDTQYLWPITPDRKVSLDYLGVSSNNHDLTYIAPPCYEKTAPDEPVFSRERRDKYRYQSWDIQLERSLSKRQTSRTKQSDSQIQGDTQRGYGANSDHT